MSRHHDDPLCTCRVSPVGYTMGLHCARLNRFLYPCVGTEGECSCERCQQWVERGIETIKSSLREQRALLRRMKTDHPPGD